MITCTWEDCTAEGTHGQKDKTGRVWAMLCEPHHNDLEWAIGEMKPQPIMKAYILARGGAKKCAEESAAAMTPAMQALMKKLKLGGE